jgi:hypothetical protein
MRERLGVRLYEDWQRLPRERRREIERALAEGRTVQDQRDAEVAARLAESVHAELLEAGAPKSRWSHVTTAIVSLAGVVSIAGGIVRAAQEGSYWWLLLALGALELALPFVWRPNYASKLANASIARELNEALVPDDAFRGA